MSPPLELARRALAGRAAWVVGGAVRDALRGAGPATDIDLVLDGDVRAAAGALARAAGGAVAFALSDEFGAWRVVARDRTWQADLNPLRGGSLAADLARRDFTVNAIARPLDGGELVDPLGGAGDLSAGRLRLAAPGALAADPLRALRLVRLTCELELEADADALRAARAAAPALGAVAAERVFGELKRIMASPRAVTGLRLAGELGLTAAVLPELDAMAGVEQNRYHHRDVAGHTLEALERAIELAADPGARLGEEHAAGVRALLSAPLADELTRGQALRFGALLHDVAKPPTRRVDEHGHVRFLGHDELGAVMARAILARLRASERLQAHVAGLVRHHLRLGFLVAEAPVDRRSTYRYLDACDPVAADVTLLSVADRLATRGARGEEAIARHLAVARAMLGPALAWHEHGRPAPLVRGDRLARELGLEPGPGLGALLGQLAEAEYAGEATTPAEAVGLARMLVGGTTTASEAAMQADRVAIITGASRGLGLELARALAGRGWRLVIDARGADALAAAERELARQTTVEAIAGDVADPAHRAALVAAAAGMGRLDALVNNASLLGPSPQPELAGYPPDVLRRVYEVNVLAPLALAQASLGLLSESGGRIVNVTSDAAVEAYPGWGGYGSAKAALEQLTAVLAAEHPALRIHAVDPGDMRTQMHQEAFPGEDISDRPDPADRVPALVELLEGERPSGRHAAGALLAEAAARDPECVFCRIVAGEVPAAVIDADERTVAFMDIAPATRGHALVVPRTHVRDLEAIGAADLAACVAMAQRIAGRAFERLGADGVNLLNSCRAAAWQTVFHFHVHVIPRYAADPLRLPWTPGPGDEAEIAAAGAALRA